MGEVVDLEAERAKPRFRFVSGESISVTTSGPVVIHCYNYWQGASTVLGLLSSGVVIDSDSVVLKRIPRPPPPPPEPPKPPELLVNREFSPPPWWRRLWRIFRPQPRLVRK